MAYLLIDTRTESRDPAINSLTHTPTAYPDPSRLQDGDLVIAFASWSSASAVLSCGTAGWNAVGTRGADPAIAVYGQFFYTVVSGGTYNVPTFTSTVSQKQMVLMFAVRDADTSAPFDLAVRTSFTSVGKFTTAAPSTSHPGELILHGVINSAGTSIMLPDGKNLQELYLSTYSSNYSQAILFSNQGDAGPIPQGEVILNSASASGFYWTVSIKNAAGGRVQPMVRFDMDVVSYYGHYSVGAGAALTWYGANQAGSGFAGGVASLGGKALTTGAPTVALGVLPQNASVINTSTTNDVIDSAWHSVSLNCTGKIFTAGIFNSRGGTSIRIGPLGILVGFSDGTNYAIFRVLNADYGWSSGVPQRVFIACGVTTPTYASGLVNWAAITQVGYFYHHLGTTLDTYSVHFAYLINNAELTGGGASAPTNAADFATIVGIQKYAVDFASIQSGSQTQIRHNLTIGDGAIPTYFTSEAASVAFPRARSWTRVANWQHTWDVSDGACAISVNAKAGDVISFDASVLSSETRQAFALDAASSGGATYSFAGASFVGLDNVWNTNVPCSLATFLRCHTILGKGTTFYTCTFKSCASAINAYVQVTAGAEFLGCAFTRGQETYAIDFTEVGDYDLSDTTFSGYTTELYVSATTGTVNITLAEGQTAPDYTSAGATVNFVSPVVMATASIVNIVPGTRLQVYNVTEDTEMVNTIVAGTSWTVSYPNGTGYSTGDVVRVRLAWMDGTDAKLPLQVSTVAASGGWTVLADQQDDVVYIANGIDGDAVTEFSEDFPNVEIDIDDPDGITYVQRGYAWYISGQMTEDGIRYFHGGMTAEDEVNYRVNVDVVDMKIQNINASPVQVVGGRLYRSDGSTVIEPGGGGIQMDYGRAYKVIVSGASVLSPEESARLMSTALETTAQAAKNNAALAAALSA